MKMLRACGLAALLLSACTSTSGVRITENQLAQLKNEKASVESVTAQFGPASSSQLMPTGQRILTYSYSTVTSDAKSYIPIVGPLMGGSGFSISTASLIFDPNGKLSSYSTNANDFRSGTSITAGGNP